MKATRSRHGWMHMFITHRPTVTLQLHDLYVVSSWESVAAVSCFCYRHKELLAKADIYSRLYSYLWRYYSLSTVTLRGWTTVKNDHRSCCCNQSGWLTSEYVWTKFIIETNVPAVLMLCLHSSLLFTAANYNICHQDGPWMLIHWETNSVAYQQWLFYLVLTSANISWSSSEYDWTRSLNMKPLFMLDESHFVHWLLHVLVQVPALDILHWSTVIGQDY